MTTLRAVTKTLSENDEYETDEYGNQVKRKKRKSLMGQTSDLDPDYPVDVIKAIKDRL